MPLRSGRSQHVGRRAVLAGALAGTAVRPARAALRMVRCGQGSTPDSPSGQGCRAFAKAVALHPLLLGVLRIEVYDDAALGDELDALRGCIDGTVDMAVATTSVIGNIVPEVGLLDAPFLFRDAARARAVLDGELGGAYAQAMWRKGINLAAWTENGVRHMTANHPIRKPADLVDLKLRVPPSEVEIASFRAMGADARPLPFTALYEALRTGVFDAQETPIALIEALRLFEVQKCLSLTAHIYSASALVVSQDLLDELAAEQQEALGACAREGGAASRRVAEAAERDGVRRLRSAGMQVVEDVDRGAFTAASRAILTTIGAKIGGGWIDRLTHAGA